MTTPVHEEKDDDSLYEHPMAPSPVLKARETILPPHLAASLDKLLDDQETPPPSNSNSITSLASSHSSAVQVLSDTPTTPDAPTPEGPKSLSHRESGEDWFDSDENAISTSTSASSSTTIPERPETEDPVPIVHSLDAPAKKPISLLSRASATFYKAFRKKKPAAPAPPPDDAPARLAQLFEAQIATLRSARTGFVDLALVRPMTERTLQAVSEAKGVLTQFGQLETRVATLRNQVETGGREAEADIVAKERILVEAKVRLAEVSEQVERLRLELRRVRKALADPCRVDRRKVAEVRRDALVSREARQHVEGRLAERRRELEKERALLRNVEKDYRDIEGDWA